MKRIAALLAIATLVLLARAAGDDLTEKETIRKTLKFGATGESRRVLVDNINGSIRVTGYDGRDVELVAYRTIRAESSDKLQEAKEKVTLDTTEESDRILVYVDAPWRCADGSFNYRGWDYYGYDVRYDFELKVPARTDLILKTINEGDILVSGVAGHFEVRHVNGAIGMKDVAGFGKVSTVNGGVTVSFRENPTGPTSFKTINGEVDVRFPGTLSASLKLKTMNGEVYTDFPVKDLPRNEATEEGHGRRHIYRSGDSFGVQIANGGPELSFNTLNGNIYIRKSEEK